MEGERKEFSAVGMRVLAVDDDQTCLKVLGAMLRQCKYHVTTSNQAVEALKMLRENKDKFDLIITDVHMPDMDGFKLLELVGYEMDLPVIMLSANGDKEFVMKGVTHGACDYLLKPVRMEELKNIWQHVVRKRNSAARERNRHSNNSNGDQGPITSGSSDHKQSRKRKDQDEDGEDDDDNTNETGNATSQKKSRVVWSPELHCKFVDAVNHLGIDKAVPKRILDLMNVEGLTRENVASHLQKYRLFLRKVASQDENTNHVMGVRDSYLPRATFDNYGDFQAFTSSNQLSVLPSVQYNGVMSKREPTLFAYNSVSRIHDTSNLDVKLQNITGSQQGNFLQRFPITMEVGQLQLQRRIQGANHNFPISVSPSSIINNPFMLQARHNSIRSGPFEANVGLSSHCSDRYNDTLQSVVPLVSCSENTLPVSVGFSPSVSQTSCNPMNFSSSGSLVALPNDLVTGNSLDIQKGFNDQSRYINIGNGQQQWVESKHVHVPVHILGSINPPHTGQFIGNVTSQSQRVNSGIYNRRSPNINGQMSCSTLYLPQQCKTDDKPIADNQLKFKDEFSSEASTSQGGLSSNGYGLEEVVMTKPGFTGG